MALEDMDLLFGKAVAAQRLEAGQDGSSLPFTSDSPLLNVPKRRSADVFGSHRSFGR